jgi:Mg-chelatase subunit ChlD
VLRPDPTVSVVGELATYALYTSVDRTTESAPGPGRAHQVEQQIADALDHGGFPLGGMTDLLCRYRTASIPNPVILTEQALVRFNQGLPPGAGCDLRLPQPLAVGACLFGIYPPDTPSVDHQFVRLQWDGATTPAARTAVAFGRWLSTVDGQRAVLRGGVRPRGMSESGDPLNPRFCAQTSAAYGRQPLSRASIEQTRQRYAQARRPGRVLLAVDGSGSMGTLIDGRRSRLVVAIRGLQRSLALLGTADEVGLWAFPSGASGRGVRQLVPIGRRDAPYRGTARSDAAVAALSGVSPAGGTPLYDTILAGVGALAAGGEDEVVALVVLTDGMDTTSRVSGPGPVEQVAGKRVRVFVVAVGEASCVVPFLVAVTEHTGGSCRQADFDTVDDVLVELLGSMWGGDHESG